MIGIEAADGFGFQKQTWRVTAMRCCVCRNGHQSATPGWYMARGAEKRNHAFTSRRKATIKILLLYVRLDMKLIVSYIALLRACDGMLHGAI